MKAKSEMDTVTFEDYARLTETLYRLTDVVEEQTGVLASIILHLHGKGLYKLTPREKRELLGVAVRSFK